MIVFVNISPLFYFVVVYICLCLILYYVNKSNRLLGVLFEDDEFFCRKD